MKLFKQFYFILYQYYFNRAKYIKSSIKFSPIGNASRLCGVLFFGWILLLYYCIIKIFSLQDIDIKYGKYIVIFSGLIFIGIVNTYFENRYLDINNQYLNKKINKSKIIFLAILFFFIPYLLLILLKMLNVL
jgi:hypothetical protein